MCGSLWRLVPVQGAGGLGRCRGAGAVRCGVCGIGSDLGTQEEQHVAWLKLTHKLHTHAHTHIHELLRTLSLSLFLSLTHT